MQRKIGTRYRRQTVDGGRSSLAGSYRRVVIKRCAIISVILFDAMQCRLRTLLQAVSNLAERENSPFRLKDVARSRDCVTTLHGSLCTSKHCQLMSLRQLASYVFVILASTSRKTRRHRRMKRSSPSTCGASWFWRIKNIRGFIVTKQLRFYQKKMCRYLFYKPRDKITYLQNQWFQH